MSFLLVLQLLFSHASVLSSYAALAAARFFFFFISSAILSIVMADVKDYDVTPALTSSISLSMVAENVIYDNSSLMCRSGIRVGQGLSDRGVRPAVQEKDLDGLQPRQSLVEVVLGRMMHNTLSDLSGTSLSPAKETLRPFLGDRYQRVDCSAGWAIEGVS
ncbi:hypothetical protein AVEN_9167-1 [Araneus ventricosus]|uniref:Uncharacterized protein n=1 Tax=Araneus ventricosus TaxID=182803 RepID=A0A4Y2HU46_ARAVE|nr:hypothetical protein AVEN_9167-1 [Araneus ventricosus]